MDPLDAAVLLTAGLAAGAVNAIAGGGSLITFPALVATGLPAVPANVTNALAVTPGYLASVYGSRTQLTALAATGNLPALLPTTVLGTLAGCLLLLATPARAFEAVVPFLILLATAGLAYQRRLQRMVGHPRTMTEPRRAAGLHLLVGTGAAYGGYFGAGLGIMLIAGLGLVLDENLARIGALKNAVAAVTALVAVVIFALFGPVDWASVVVVAPASMVGGYAGARLAQHLPARLLRAVIVTAGLVVATALLLETY